MTRRVAGMRRRVTGMRRWEGKLLGEELQVKSEKRSAHELER